MIAPRAVRVFAAVLIALAFGGPTGPAAHPALAQETAPKPDQRGDIPPPLVAPVPKGPANTAPGTAAATSAEPVMTGDGSQGGPVDFDAWDAMAQRAETALSDPHTTDVSLNLLRSQVADWREALLKAQGANSDRIATLRDQIAALGPVPKEGETEAPEIAIRRTELNDQLSRLQAPGIAAVEAYRRADGLIREIDRTLRERQTSKLLQIWPAPANPANWPAGAKALSETVKTIAGETIAQVRRPEVRSTAVDRLPVVLLTGLLGLFLTLRSRRIIESWTLRLQRREGSFRQLGAFLLSLGQIVLPTVGVLLIVFAIHSADFLGVLGKTVLGEVASAAVLVYAAVWLARWVFPRVALGSRTLRMTEAQRSQGRMLTLALALVIGLSGIIEQSLNEVTVSEAALAVLQFPTIVAAGFLLNRMGRLLRVQFQREEGSEEGGYTLDGILALMARGVALLGLFAPVLAAIGYVAAATALVYPAALSLALIGFLVLMQRVAVEIYALLIRDEKGAQEALMPVLIGFALVVVSLPVFALIWGARVSDITELWTRFQEGFQLGETRVSPADFFYFVVVFAFGYAITRLLQGALRGTILPRTALDPGGQTAVISGVGYLGIFVSALVAIDTAGIDLSGLAIVAGALSVGIGFGLQTIVGNFVSGIILLIERPVSEGDWIEVGGVQGTVKSISVRSTRIQTFDRSDVIVPNQDLIAGRVTNWTRFSLSGRLIVPVGVAYDSDTRKVEAVLREIAEDQPMALLNPPPTVLFMGFGADSMNFEIRMILRDVNFSMTVRSEINHRIAERFRAEGIQIPFAQREVRLVNAGELGGVLKVGGRTGGPVRPEDGGSPSRLHLGAAAAPEAAPELAPELAAERPLPHRDEIDDHDLDPEGEDHR